MLIVAAAVFVVSGGSNLAAGLGDYEILGDSVHSDRVAANGQFVPGESPRSIQLAAADGGATRSTEWRDNVTTRLQALAILQSLNADLLSHDSATLTLDRWCATHRLASPALIVAERVRDVEKQPTAEQREILGVNATDPVRYRRVRLRCGDRVLSEADNFYVPARLTPDMNKALDTSDIAFGRAVQALKFRRRTLSATLLWSPLPQGWEMGEPVRVENFATLRVPAEVLQHRAVLTLPDGTPISHVVETYKSEVLAFPEPEIVGVLQ